MHTAHDLPRLGPFDRLPAPTRAAMLPHTRELQFRRGEHLARRGDPATHLVIVLDGVVGAEIRGTDRDRRLTLDLIGRGGLLGEAALLGVDHWTCDAAALDNGAATLIDIAGLTSLRAQDPHVDEAAIGILAERLDALTAKVLEISHVPLRARLRTTLADLAELFAPGDIRLTHAQLATIMGTNRSTISEVLTAEHRLGLLQTRRGAVHVPDPAALRAAT